jgi:CRISPR-associated protein Csc3
LFATYLVRHARFGSQPRPTAFGDSLHQYVTTQHKQCVQCSDPFPTMPWMSADVRSDIAVQTFSNRLRGGPGEPKKQVCGICQAQFLVERLSYLEIRGEHTMYLHLFPYSYLSQSFVRGLQRVMRKLQEGDLRALWLDGDRAMQRYINDQRIIAPMLTHTRKGTSHVYGIYLPSHAEALIGNLLILPINPAGNTDTERFLFGLEYALILQRYFSCRVVLSASPVVPFDQESLGDLNTDMTPLSCRGLIDQNVYRQFEEKSAKPGKLPVLWQQLSDLYAIKRRVSTGQDDPLPDLVEALAFHPLGIFYTTEKLIEQRVRDDRKTRKPDLLLIDISRYLLPAVARLAQSKGGAWMEQLSAHMQRLSQIAWKHRLVGRTWAKNSLMAALDEVFRKIAQRSKAIEHDTEALKAATVEDIFAYLERIADPKYPAGQRKWNASKEFVDLFYSGIYNGIYGGSTARLLGDEKLLRSIYMFYMREQAPRKVVDSAEKGEIENLAAITEE